MGSCSKLNSCTNVHNNIKIHSMGEAMPQPPILFSTFLNNRVKITAASDYNASQQILLNLKSTNLTHLKLQYLIKT